MGPTDAKKGTRLAPILRQLSHNSRRVSLHVHDEDNDSSMWSMSGWCTETHDISDRTYVDFSSLQAKPKPRVRGNRISWSLERGGSRYSLSAIMEIAGAAADGANLIAELTRFSVVWCGW